MITRALLPVALLALCPASTAQTEVLRRIDPPSSPLHGWGNAFVPLDDVDGDGVPDLLIGVHGHGGGLVATIHSGASGDLLYEIDAPHAALFYGSAIFTVADETGDGLREVIVMGSHSGAGNSPPGTIRVHSSADGALLRSMVPGPGITIHDLAQSEAFSPGDVDGDGTEDVYCWTTSPLWPSGVIPLTLLSGRTGELIHATRPAPNTAFLVGPIARMSDHDGDGLDDVAIVMRSGGINQIEIRSSATGAVLARHASPGLDVLTGNHEPFLSISDVDGDGLRDVAVGAVFFSFVGIYSSATGALLRSWDCQTAAVPCVGSRLIETADLNGNGSRDIIALESQLGPSNALRIYGLDPVHGDVLFEQPIVGLNGGYTGIDRMVALDGVDVLGFPSMAFFEGTAGQVVLRRVLPELGDHDCFGQPNAAGVRANLLVRGSASLATAHMELVLEDGAPQALAVFAFGTDRAQLPIGGAVLCVGTSPGLVRAGFLDSVGGATAMIDLTSLGALALESWSFQAIFRDAAAGGLRASNAVTLTVQL